MGRITHFELTGTDPDDKAAFFTSVFGWESTASPFLPGYLLASTGDGPGIDGAIMTSDYQSQAVIVWLEVDDIRASIDAVVQAGGRSLGDINELPGQGLLCYFADPDGVVYGLRQPEIK